MSFSNAKAYLEAKGLADRIKVFSESSATVELAAKALGCQAKQIAKTMTFFVAGEPIMIVCAGNVKVDNPKYKAYFHEKAKMIPFAEVEACSGHAVGGVCPFGVNSGVKIYLDVSLKENEIVYPAAGDEHSAVELSVKELEGCIEVTDWVDVCKEIV